MARTSGTTWTQEQKIVPSISGDGTVYYHAVSICKEGTRLVTSWSDRPNARIFIYKYNGSSWVEEFYDSIDDLDDYAGYSVSIGGKNGSKCITGEPYGDWGDGAAYIYTYI